MLDRLDPTPLYVQLARSLRRRIVSGEFRNGETIPSEAELQQVFSTTRGTVRNAISVLVNEGLIEQVHGKGTFVRLASVNYSLWNFGSFTEFARSRHEAPVSLVITHEVAETADDRVLNLVRARGLASESGVSYVHLDTSTLSLSRFPGLDEYDFGAESLYRVIREEYGVSPHRSELTISAVNPDEMARRLLEIEPTVECVTRVSGVVYDAADNVVERTTVIYSPQQTIRVVTLIDVGAAPGGDQGVDSAQPAAFH